MELLILIVFVLAVVVGWRVFGNGSTPSRSSSESSPNRVSTTTAASDDPLAATNALEAVLLRAAETVSLNLSTGSDFSPDLEALSPEVAKAAEQLHEAGEVDAIDTARSFFGVHVLTSLQSQPALMAGAKAIVARTEVWVDGVLGPYLGTEPQERSHDLGKEVVDADDSYRTVQQAWSAAGLNIAFHGPGSADELVQMLSRRVPGLKGDPVGPFVQLIEPNMRLWVSVVEGSSGSACVVSEATRPEDGEFDAAKLSPGIISVDVLNSPAPTADGQGQWDAVIFSRGTTDDPVLAERLRNGKVLPLDGLESLVR